jgi:predicted amidohydrolase YtcJ
MFEASLVILNANVVTLNPKQRRAEAIAIQDGKIAAVGSNREIRKHIRKKTRIINAKNKTVVPGLVDCHVHMTGFGHSSKSLDLRNVKSVSEMQKRLREFAERNHERGWILGGKWDQERFREKRYPNRWDLDAAVKDKPVFLTRVCGHTGVVNSKVLKMAGITKRTAVDGGKVDLDEATGEPNGILRENAMDLVWRVTPKPTQEELEKACVAACKKAVEAGLTCVHWIVTSADEINTICRLGAEGKLPLRVCLGISVDLLDELIRLGFPTGFGNDMVKIGFVKILADGSLGARTAALEEPYSDKPETTGMMLYTQKKLNNLVLKAHEAGLQLAIHAIGDRAADAALKSYKKALKEYPRKNHRHRIEHCSVLNPKLIKRMKHLNIIASVQPHFVISDFWAADRVGKTRARWVYPFKTLMREGLVVVSGSDCPVEPIDPLLGIWAAVARKSLAEEGLTVEEALRTYTANAAYASFDEDERGTIAVGKYADLTVLSDDLFGVRPDDIKKIDVEMTIVDGKVIHARKPFLQRS